MINQGSGALPQYSVLDDIDVPEKVLRSWQITTDLLACIAHIPAALIMRAHAHEIEVFVASHSEGNVYHPGEHASLNTGLYCENVISNRQALLIPNALTSPGWAQNPDVALGMISYYGLPLNWPNGEVFGTICILDNKEHHYDHLVKDLIGQFRDSIQLSLYHIYHSSLATEQRDQAREALRDSEALFRAVFEHAAIGIAQVDLSGRFLQINREFCRVIGYSQEEILAQHMTYQQITLPEDLLQEAETIARLLHGDIDQYSVEKRYLHKMGQVVWVNLSVHLLRDDAQQPLYYISAVQDISARKLAEEELKLAGLVYNNSSEAMAITDAHGAVLAINPAFTKMTGYALEEIKGQSITLLRSEQHDAAFYATQNQAIHACGQWQGEVWSKRKNGAIFPTWLTINTSYQTDGAVHRRVDLFSDISAIKDAEALILSQANFDQLTKLPNRQLFQDRLQQTLKLSQRENQKCALLFIDLDRFKEINDTHGHNVGDTLLIEAAARIVACVRKSDTVARLGGDEFTVILNDIHDNMMIAHIAQNIIDHLSEPFITAKKEAFISASVGIAIYPEDATDVQQLLKVADQAMYVAKNAGRGCYRFFTKLMQQESDFRIRLSTDLRQALQLKQFSVHYQPIIELSTGRINKAEALLRWKHPDLGYISPDIFIPICEHYGTIHEIGNWVFVEAVKQGARLKQLLGREIEIAVNKSPVQFKANEEMMHNWIKLLENIHFPTKCVVIEITEGVLMDLVGNIEEKLMGFHNAGMHIAIDDFGTGYSSLSYLKKFNVDYLKIDRSFTCNLTTDSSELAICEAIIEMAHRLKIKVIAEGIETETQLHLLEDIHCDFGQGYLFAKPMPAEEFEKLLIDLG